MSDTITDYKIQAHCSLNTSQKLQTSGHDTGSIKITKSISYMGAAACTDHKK